MADGDEPKIEGAPEALNEARAADVGLPSVRGSCALALSSDVVLCRQLVRRIADSLGFSLLGRTKLETATSELGRNTVKYGGGREMRWEALGGQSAVPGLRLVFEDRGPGIADVELAMSDGFTTGKGMGMGLPGAKRLVESFDIASAVGVGTTVTIVRWV